MGLMTRHTEHTSNKHMRKENMSEYRQLQMKEATIDPLYLRVISQPKCSGAVASYHGSVEALGDISR